MARKSIYPPNRNRSRHFGILGSWAFIPNGSNFIVRQVFFCGSEEKDEFNKWKAGLSELAKRKTKRKVEQTLKIEIDDEAFDRLYGFQCHPIPKEKGRKIAVRVISQFGEESTKVLTL